MRPGIAVMALIDHEGLAQGGHVDLVGAEQEHSLDLALAGALENARDVPAAGLRQEPEVEAADPCRRRVQDVEAVPAVLDQAEALRRIPRQAEHRGAIGTRQRAHAQD